jgi:hypothetical protein
MAHDGGVADPLRAREPDHVGRGGIPPLGEPEPGPHLQAALRVLPPREAARYL